MKFLIQTVNRQVTFDFAFELLKSLEYLKWKNIPYIVEFCEIYELASVANISTQGLTFEDIKDFTPVGSVDFVKEFCHIYVKENPDKYLKPINIPKCLEEFVHYGIGHIKADGDDIQISSFKEEIEDGQEIYVKSEEIIKSKDNGYYRQSSLADLDGEYQFTITDNIKSEWRVFVYNDDILDCRCYSGDCFAYPSKDRICAMVKKYYEETNHRTPPAYTLDVYVSDDDNQTYIMEIHEFFSCGLYGFSDHRRLPYMLSRTFKLIKNYVG